MKKIEIGKVHLDKDHLSQENIATILTPPARWMEIQANLKFQKE
jgi:hypothetical protein